ncbi:MAG: oligosaccharide flippase family protein [Pirellulaceae bacterium]|nr:oligosaccharide flippase family protein [Pirellulaceae bacterium]
MNKQGTEHRPSAKTFLGRVAAVATGNVIAQACAFLAFPLLARIYTPSEFGILGVYLAVVGVLQVFGTFRFDDAVIVADHDDDSERLASLALRIALTISTGLTVACLIYLWLSVIHPSFVPRPIDSAMLLAIPLGIAVDSIFLVFRAVSVRLTKFKAVSVALVVSTVSKVVIQVVAGWFGVGAIGLIGGHILGFMLGGATMVIAEPATFNYIVRAWKTSSKGMWQLAREFRDFGTYDTLNALLNSLSRNLPYFLLTTFFGLSVAGAFTMAVRLVMTPLNLISQSLRHVVLQRMSGMSRNGEDLLAFVRQQTLILAGAMLVVFVLFFLATPLVVAFVLGPEWELAGQYARWLIFWGACMVLNVPSVCFLKVMRRQYIILIHQIVLLTVRAGVLTLAGMMLGAIPAIALFAISSAVLNIGLVLYANLLTRSSRSPWVIA